jgi:hypothetical protein
VFAEQIPIKPKILEAMPRICYFAKSDKRANLLIFYNAQWAINLNPAVSVGSPAGFFDSLTTMARVQA